MAYVPEKIILIKNGEPALKELNPWYVLSHAAQEAVPSLEISGAFHAPKSAICHLCRTARRGRNSVGLSIDTYLCGRKCPHCEILRRFVL